MVETKVFLPLRFCLLGILMPFTLTLAYPSYHNEYTTTPSAAAGEPFMSHEYTRFPEVERQCRSFLSSASKLDVDANQANVLQSELSFVMGDWIQASGDSPLMPFVAGDAPQNASDLPEPLRLVTFTVYNIDRARNSPYALNVSGALGIGISRNGTVPQMGEYQFQEFRIWPGSSELRILFEGVYIEPQRGGDRILCLLGNALLPSRGTNSSDPWGYVEDPDSFNFQPPLSKDDQILFVIRYPKTFTLTTRAVRGEMKSLNGKTSLSYFDKVQFLSQLGPYSNYQYGSEELVSKACDPYPYQDDIVGSQFEVYRGNGLCGILDQFVSGEIMSVVPNWKCNSTDEYCRKLGPFATETAINATDGGFGNVGLKMQDIRCEPRFGPDNTSTARVSAVFRVIPSWENQYMAGQRTGLNGMTLSAEGIWNSSSGQLCMVGCLGLEDAGCHSRICLYVPTFFSINQRSIIHGRISKINDSHGMPHFTLSFEKRMHPVQLWNKPSSNSFTAYHYSKIKLAGAFLERSEPFDFGMIIKKSLLSYPKKGDNSDDTVNLSNLAEDLTLHTPAVADMVPKVGTEMPFLEMEVLSLGSLLGRRYWELSNASFSQAQTSASTAISTEKDLLLNVSAELTLSSNLYTNVSVLYLEGLYNPLDGNMYLIGCRDVRASWKILFESMDLEDGLDCLIEVKVEYPPTTARWLMNPTAMFSITSQRNDDDPLHFSPVKLQTLPILYRQQREDILSRRGVEGVLRILTLSMAIAFIVSQLLYIRDNLGVVPYISLVMLAVQALGYSIPLITGAEALFARFKSESYESPSLEFEKKPWFQMIDYLVKILVLVAFLLTLRLGQKVWKSRIRLLTRTPLEPGRVPNDKRVLLTSSGIHVAGFLLVLIVHLVKASHRPVQQDTYMDSRGKNHQLHEWEMELEEYIGLVQDFFLLPQIIGNILWRITCKPLRKSYYVGITIVRLLPHVYDFLRAPVFNPYFSQQYEFVNPNLDFYSKFGDVAIPVTTVVFAAAVYIQQTWNYDQLNQMLRSGQKRLLPLGSRVYERLPSMSFEAELVSGVNTTEIQDNSSKNEKSDGPSKEEELAASPH